MAGAIRMVSLSLAADPRNYALFALGGAGPLHSTALAREFGIPRVLAPWRPGITNALGCVVADLRHDYVTTINTPLDRLDPATLVVVFEDQTRQAMQAITMERIQIAGTRCLYSVDMRFGGQNPSAARPVGDAQVDLAEPQTLIEQVCYDRFRGRLDRIRSNLFNVNTSVTGMHWIQAR
jgi:N-methylhydantoinase A